MSNKPDRPAWPERETIDQQIPILPVPDQPTLQQSHLLWLLWWTGLWILIEIERQCEPGIIPEWFI